MNILYLADPNDNHDLNWISFFTEKRDVNAFLVPRTIHKISPRFEKNNPTIQLLDSIPNFSTFRFYETIATAVKIKRMIQKHKIELIHVLFAEPNALWCLFKWYFGLPIVVTCRGTDVLKTIPRTFKEKSLINFFVSAAYCRAFRRADFITGTSQAQLDSITGFSGRINNMSVVRTGVDITKLNAKTISFFPRELTGDFILFPRYIKPLYNHEFCIDAIDLLPSEVKTKYKMVFVGKNKEEKELGYQNFLEQKMKATAGVEFVFLPEVSQEAIYELYKRSALVVMTPHSDGSPVSAMDAIACGAKVILGPLAYDKEIFLNWTYQLKTWSTQELSELIVHCLTTKEKVDVARYAHLVDRNVVMNKVGEIYSRLLQKEKS